jgi:hypothetical protein
MEKPQNGDIIEFLGKNAIDFHLQNSKKVLKIGKRYTVDYIFSDVWGIYVYLNEVPNRSFRSEMFALIKRPTDYEEPNKGDKKNVNKKRKITKKN